MTTGSGDVRVESARDELAVKTGSGDAHVLSMGGEAVFTTGSGDLVVAEVASGRVTAKTASGDVRIGVVSGTPVWTDVRTASGRLTSTLPSTGEPAPRPALPRGPRHHRLGRRHPPRELTASSASDRAERSTAMYDSLTEIELIARHRIAERVRYSPARPAPSAADPAAQPTAQDFIATPRRQ